MENEVARENVAEDFDQETEVKFEILFPIILFQLFLGCTIGCFKHTLSDFEIIFSPNS